MKNVDIEKILNLVKKPMALSLLLNIAFLLFFLLFGSRSFYYLDDYFMSSVLTGAYGGEYDIHLYFIQTLYGYLLKPLYALFPHIGWYYIFEVFFVFCSFTVITLAIFRQMGRRPGFAVSLLFLFSVAPDFYFNMNFTQCAEILTAAGTLLLIVGGGEKRKIWVGFGIVFLTWGFVMRSQAFFLATPFFIFAASLYALLNKKISSHFIVGFLCCCIVIWGTAKLNDAAYQTDGYKQYAAYQGPRAVLGDGRYYDYDATYSDLEERGFSGEDFLAARKWFFYDTEMLSLSKLRPILESIQNNRYSLNTMRTIFSVVLYFSKSLWSINAWCWCLFCLLLSIECKKYGRFIPWLSMGLVVLCFGYMFYLNRLVPHVEIGIWLYGTVMLIPFIKKDSLTFLTCNKHMQVYIAVFLLAIFAINCYPMFDRTEDGSVEKDAYLQSLIEYMEQRNDDAFLLPYNLYKRVAASKNRSAVETVLPRSWQNIFPLGYWNIYLPGMVQELEKRKIKNPVKDIVKDNVYYVYERESIYYGPQSFWEMHYGMELFADTILRIGKIDVLKYSIKGGEF